MKNIFVKTVERSFESLECLHSYSCILAMLIALIFFVTTKLFTCNMLFFRKCTKTHLRQCRASKIGQRKTPGPPFQGRGGGIMLGGICLQASEGMDAPDPFLRMNELPLCRLHLFFPYIYIDCSFVETGWLECRIMVVICLTASSAPCCGFHFH